MAGLGTGPGEDIGGVGTSGVSGDSGYSGVSGRSGFSGKSGFSGTSGLSGTGGSAGASGVSGTSGYSGTSGFSGTSGVGASGFSGASGASGSNANTVTTSVLLSSTSVNLNEGTGAKQTLYTCPASRRAVITNIVMQKFSGTATTSSVSIGWNAGANDVVPLFTTGAIGSAPTSAVTLLLSSYDAASATALMTNEPVIGVAADILGFKVATPEGSALTAIVDVYGYLTDTNGVPIANVNGTGDSAAISPASVSTSSVAISTILKETITTDTSATPTVNTPVGIVRIASGNSTITVTVSGMTSSWAVFATVRTNDATLKTVSALPGSGSVVLTGNATATANTDIQIQIIQPN